MRPADDFSCRRAPLLFAACALLAAACAHAPEEGEASADLATDHSFGSGDLYHSATDEDRLPEGAADNPYAARYHDRDAEVTLERRIALYTPDPGEMPPPDDLQDRYVAVSSDLPVGTVVRVTRMDDGRSVIVAVRRMEDPEELPRSMMALSRKAGRRLGLMDRGVIPARVEVLVSPEAHIR